VCLGHSEGSICRIDLQVLEWLGYCSPNMFHLKSQLAIFLYMFITGRAMQHVVEYVFQQLQPKTIAHGEFKKTIVYVTGHIITQVFLTR